MAAEPVQADLLIARHDIGDGQKTAATFAEIDRMLREAGFGDVRFKLMGGSIVALHTGTAQ